MTIEKPLFLDGNSSYSVEVSSICLLSILDHHLRRPEDADRAVGVLMGSRTDATSAIAVTHCFPIVLQSETQMPDIEHLKLSVELYAPLNGGQLRIVGFYASTQCDLLTAQLNDYFARETGIWPLVHLSVIPPTFEDSNDNVIIHTYIDAPVGSDSRLGTIFHEIPHKIVASSQEKYGINALLQSPAETLKSDLDLTHDSINELKKLVDLACKYANDVVQGEKEGDEEVGKILVKALNSIPLVEHEKLEESVNAVVKDLKLIQFLKSIVEKQVLLSSKLTSNKA